MILKNLRAILRINQITCEKIRLRHSGTNHLHLSYITGASNHLLLPDTIGQRLEYAAQVYKDRDAFVFAKTGERLSFQQLKERAEDFASGLVALGFKKGDRLGVWATNCIEWIIAQYATAIIGVIQVNINPAYKSHELEYALNKVKCKGLVMSETYKSQNFIDILSNVCPEIDSAKPGKLNAKRLPALKDVIVIGDKNYNGCFTFKQLLNGGDSDHRETVNEIKQTVQHSDPINIQYTSGTTGSPKGVVLSHHMILNNAYLTTLAQDYHKKTTVLLLQVPLYHCFGMVIGSLSGICHGMTSVMPSHTFNPEESLKAIQEEKCTTIYGTPTMFIDLYTHPNFSKYDVSSLNAGIMSGSSCPVEVVNDCVKKLHTKNIVVLYGMTETSPVITLNNAHDSLEHRTQTIGKALDYIEVKVVDAHGKLVPVGEPGELLVRGHNTMIGYWEDKEKTNETFTHDRFLKSGDIVKMDSRGYFYHLGRLKDMLIRGGENIYPSEIEEFLHKHPKIADVYVIGVPDKRMGEEVCACVKLNENQTMTGDELKSYCKDQIAHFKIPKYVEFMSSFPMTVTGKIQKNKLREQMVKKFQL